MAVFTDGFEFHRDTTDADSLKRMALVRAGFLVWSLTWHDLEFVFGKAPDVPDLLAGVKAGDGMAPLQQKLDARWDTAGLRSRLAEPTLLLLVNYLRAPEPTRWKQAVFTALFDLFDRQRMLSGALRASFDRATAEALPGQVRETMDDLPPPVAMAGIGAWHGTAPAFFDLFAAFPLAAVQQGDPDAASVVVHLHDDKEPSLPPRLERRPAPVHAATVPGAGGRHVLAASIRSHQHPPVRARRNPRQVRAEPVFPHQVRHDVGVEYECTHGSLLPPPR